MAHRPSASEAVASTVRRYPSTAAVPAAVLVLLVALGVWGVFVIADREAESKNVLAAALARDSAASLYGDLFKTYSVLQSLAAIIGFNPYYNATLPAFKALAPPLLAQAPRGSLNIIAFIANHIVRATYTDRPAPPPNTPFVVGADLISVKSPIRAQSLAAIAAGALSMQGPVSLAGRIAIGLSVPVFVSNVSADEWFGAPPARTNCSFCYNETTRTKAAYCLVAGVDVDFIAGSAGLSSLADKGYAYQLVSPQPQVTRIAGEERLPSSGVHEANVTVPNGEWVLRVRPRQGYRPSWFKPVLAAVIVTACIVPMLLFAVLHSRRQHQALLEALLPKAMIEELCKAKGQEDLARYQQRNETPADMLLDMLGGLLEGRMPSTRDIVLCRTAIRQAYDIYRPVNMGKRIRGAEGMDAEVASALMQQLGQNELMTGSCNLDAAAITEIVDIYTEVLNGEDNPLDSAARGLEMQRVACEQNGLKGALSLIMTPAPAGWAADGALAGERRSKLSSSGLDATAGGGEGGGGGGGAGVRNTAAVQASWSKEAAAQASLPPPAALIDEAERLLSGADGWQLDTFALQEATQGHALSCLGFYLMHRGGLIKQFNINPAVLARYLRHIESGYLDNPYHNAIHAADVLRSLHVILHQGGLTQHYVDRLGLMATYMAAVVHDYGHLGLTNDFLVASKAPLALRYNDRSPMENHHCAAAFIALQQPGLNFLEALPDKDATALRKTVIELVLATDMKQHFGIVSHFKTVHRLGNVGVQGSPRRVRDIGRGAADEASTNARFQGVEQMSLNPTEPAPKPLDEAERLLALQVAFKCADLGHLTAALPVHKRWLERLEEEFFLQGDKERETGMPISPLFDRAKQGASKSQVGFYDFVVLPLFNGLAEAFPGASQLLDHALANYSHWKEHQQTEDGRSSPTAAKAPIAK